MAFTQGATLLFELQLPSNYSKASAVGLALRGGTPEALANAQALLDKYNSRGKKKAKPAPAPPSTGNATTGNSTTQ